MVGAGDNTHVVLARREREELDKITKVLRQGTRNVDPKDVREAFGEEQDVDSQRSVPEKPRRRRGRRIKPKNTWISALKEWNKNKPAWCLPRRGSDDHKAVKQLQGLLQKR